MRMYVTSTPRLLAIDMAAGEIWKFQFDHATSQNHVSKASCDSMGFHATTFRGYRLCGSGDIYFV